jgi:hypothetical protein
LPFFFFFFTPLKGVEKLAHSSLGGATGATIGTLLSQANPTLGSSFEGGDWYPESNSEFLSVIEKPDNY